MLFIARNTGESVGMEPGKRSEIYAELHANGDPLIYFKRATDGTYPKFRMVYIAHNSLPYNVWWKKNREQLNRRLIAKYAETKMITTMGELGPFQICLDASDQSRFSPLEPRNGFGLEHRTFCYC